MPKVFRPRSSRKQVSGPGRCAHHALHLVQVGHQCIRTEGHACHEVVVAAQILGGRVEHNVHAHLDGLDVVGRGQRGVDDGQDLLRSLATFTMAGMSSTRR